VIETGDYSMMGSIAKLTSQTTDRKSTLKKELQQFVFIIAGVAIIMAIIVIIC